MSPAGTSRFSRYACSARHKALANSLTLRSNSFGSNRFRLFRRRGEHGEEFYRICSNARNFRMLKLTEDAGIPSLFSARSRCKTEYGRRAVLTFPDRLPWHAKNNLPLRLDKRLNTRPGPMRIPFRHGLERIEHFADSLMEFRLVWISLEYLLHNAFQNLHFSDRFL